MPPDAQSPLSGVELFSSLPEEQLRNLERRTPEVSVAKGQIFYTPWHRSESFFFLLKGRMRIYRVRGAREVTVAVKHSGEVFGEASLAGLAQGAYAQALEPARVGMMRRQTLHRVIAERPEIGAVMIELLAECLDVHEDRLEDISLKETPARLASLLLRMIEEEGVADDGSYMIPSHYTHQILATMIGCERPALTRALRELRLAGAVWVSDRHLHVTNLKALERCAE